MNLEICVDNIDSAINAYKGGADRIELCSGLDLGGLTPTLGLLNKIKSKITIPVYVLIRHRIGDFNYSEAEIDTMCQDILSFTNADGFVFGVLNNEQQMNLKAMQRLIQDCNHKPVTFHRAIDVAKNPLNIIDQCIDLDIDHILSSGQAPTAVEGISQLMKYNDYAGNRISIMPGSGINLENIHQFLESDIQDIHMSLRGPEFHNDKNSFGFGVNRITEENSVKKVTNILKQKSR